MEKAQGALGAMFGLGKYLAKSALEKPLQHLVEFRVSQLNGCTYCLDRHSKDLHAALDWAEAVTKLAGCQVSDEVYDAARREFSEQELIDLTMCVVAINSWNRLNIAFRTEAGSYQPGQWASVAN